MIVISIFAVILLAFEASANQPHIVQGNNAKFRSHPWMISIEITPNYVHCGASLLRVRQGLQKSDLALTAAHCVCGKNATEERFYDDWSVLAGNYMNKKKDVGEERRRIVSGQCHQKFNTRISFDHDLAILKLASPIAFTQAIQGIDLPGQNEPVKIGQECIVAGWGAIGMLVIGDFKIGNWTNTLQELKVEIQPGSVCTNRYIEYKPSMICAMPKKQPGTPCTGDSGGPLVCEINDRHVQIGVVSFGNQNCEAKIPAVYSNVKGHLAWITMNALTEL